MNEQNEKTKTAQEEKTRVGLSEAEMRGNLVRLAFGGDPRRLEAFLEALRRELPPGTAAVMRGSSVTGVRWSDGAPFDAEGPSTSDLDLTLVGGDVLGWYAPEAFYISGVHTKPLSDKEPGIAPKLLPLRRQLVAMVARPVDIQGTRDWVMFVREYFMGQPYLTLLGKVETP
jgi:hypothetical protein